MGFVLYLCVSMPLGWYGVKLLTYLCRDLASIAPTDQIQKWEADEGSCPWHYIRYQRILLVAHGACVKRVALGMIMWTSKHIMLHTDRWKEAAGDSMWCYNLPRLAKELAVKRHTMRYQHGQSKLEMKNSESKELFKLLIYLTDEVFMCGHVLNIQKQCVWLNLNKNMGRKYSI